MAIQQLTQPIINPISAFDATKQQSITFVVIGGAQVVGNRLIIRNNQTGEVVYDKIQSSMKLEHILPANSLKNNNFYNAVIYTIDNGNDESVASVPIPFYCYTQPVLTIDNIPSSGTIENGTYSFQGNYVQNEGELLNSYKFILYDSNKEILSQSSLIYYNTDNSLTYLFSGMSNNTSYYVELTGETVNGTILTSGIKSFTVRYIQPASFAICDLVNDCENGYIQISSNIVAIDGKSNPTPPTYIDDKEVDLRESNSWVEWDNGFNIKDDFTLRAWGREFNPYEPIITLSNQQNTSEMPNKIEMKWMIADVLKVLPDYKRVSGQNINLSDSKAEPIKDIYIGGNIEQYKLAKPYDLELTDEQKEVQSQLTNNYNYIDQTYLSTAEGLAILNAEYPGTPSVQVPSEVLSLGDIGNIINISDFNITYKQGYFQETNTNYEIKPNFLYTLSYYFDVNEATTDIYFSVGYGKDSYEHDINSSIQYVNNTTGRNVYTFITPSDIPEGNTLWVKFAKTIIQADVDINIRNIELENRGIVSDFQRYGLYNVRLRTSKKNLFNYKSPYYILTENISLSSIQNGYAIEPAIIGEKSYLGIGWQNTLNPNETYAISYFTEGNLKNFELYTTRKGTYEIIDNLQLNEGVFTMPNYVCDLQLRFYVNSEAETDNLQIWNIQIEPNQKTEFEVFEEEGKDLLFGEPLRGIKNYRDLVCLESPNLLNPTTQKAKVNKGEDYYISQSGEISCVIDFINEDGNLIKKETFVQGTFKVPDNCIELKLEGIVADTILTNKIQIVKGTKETIYYPYVDEPSLIRYIGKIELTGEENWIKSSASNDDVFVAALNISDLNVIEDATKTWAYSNRFFYTGSVVPNAVLIYNEGVFVRFSFSSKKVSSLDGVKNFFKNNKTSLYYILETPEVSSLTSSNIDILKSYSTYNPITNIFVDNTIQSNLELSYVNDYTEQETKNAYALLRCYNQNNLPYIIHSNYIDIPKDTDKVFIWVRRKNNIFDLKIENLGDYSEPENPDDPNKPVVSLEIKDSDITDNSITVTASSIDNLGLTTVRFSKNNGDTWDEIIQVDGLSSINTYTFTGLVPNTLYTIRVEAIDIDNNIGGISQQIRTKI